MKPWLVVPLIVIVGGLGFVSGGKLAGSGSSGTVGRMMSGSPYGACSALEAAASEHLLPPEAAARLYQEFLDREEKVVRKYDRSFQFKRSEQNCPAVLNDVRTQMQDTGQ